MQLRLTIHLLRNCERLRSSSFAADVAVPSVSCAVLVLMPLPPVGSSRHYEAEAYAHKKDVCGADELAL